MQPSRRTSTFILALVGIIAAASCGDSDDDNSNSPTLRVFYDGNGHTAGNPPSDPTVYAEGTYAPVMGPGDLDRTGHAFVGWNLAADGSDETFRDGDSLMMGNSSVTLYAQWGATYTVTYDGNGNTSGSVPVDNTNWQEGTYATVLGPQDLEKTGNTFVGWNTASDGSGASHIEGGDLFMDADLTLYARWTTSATYTVSYDGNGSTGGTVPIDSNNYEDGATVTVLGNTGSLVATAYTFAGWNTAANGTGMDYAGAATFTIGAANVVLYARWTTNPTYTVSYDDNGSTGGTVPSDSNNYEVGTTVTVSGNTGNLVKTSNTFVGWNTVANGDGIDYAASATFTMGSANVTLFAQWTVNLTYTVTYDDNGSTGGAVPTDSNSYEQGATVTVSWNSGDLRNEPAAEAAQAYNFGGWNTVANGGGIDYAASDTFAMGSANLTLYAQWVPFVIGDTGPADGNVDAGNGQTLRTTVFYDKGAFNTDYSFDGNWRYLEAMNGDVSELPWIMGGSTPTTLNGGTRLGLGTGKSNTADIIGQTGHTQSSANACNNRGSGFYLPSQVELQYLHTERATIGGFENGEYWSSTEEDATQANVVDMGTAGGGVVPRAKSVFKWVRCVRRF